MLKVIVADDMEMIREGIKAMLEQLLSGRMPAKFIRMWMVFIPLIRVLCQMPGSFRKFPMMKCWNSHL